MFSFLTYQIFINSKTALAAPSDWHVMIGAPNFYGDLDAGGYSDWIWWGYEPNHHPYSYHEVLSGEYGAALYYNSISTEPNAMWLTDLFVYPDWTTDSNFAVSGTPSSWNNLNNPVPPNQYARNDAYQWTTAYNTGQSILLSDDGKIRVTIDYEVVDLGEGNWSPMSIRDATGQIGFVKSDRFLFLQTYTITNLQNDADITGLELYQLLHSHGANDYGPTVHASYTAANYNDPLANYIPYNPVHTIGNFCYDFTQWNNINDPNRSSWVTHTDWVGFSSTVAPDVFECGDYNSTALESYGKPEQGVHISVEKRILNQNPYRYGETAGAMGWYLPNLGPQESTSITVAFMFGYGPIDYNEPIPSSDADFNNDGIVNFFDFAVIAKSWKTSTGNADYNDICDLHNDGTIDYKDLDIFCKDWLWQPGQEQSDPLKMMGSGVGQGMTQSLGFTDVRYLTEQPQPVLEPQLQPELQSEPEPQSQYEPSYDTQVLIDWLEELWLTDEEVRSACTEADWLEFIETIRQTPVE